MEKKTNFKSMLEMANTGAEYPIMDSVKKNPELFALMSKLVAPALRPTFDNAGHRSISVPTYNNFHQISQDISEKSNDAQSIMQLFPDMELSAQILISSIISPKDMGGGEITYTVPDGMFFAEASSPLLGILREYFHQDYKIAPLLPKILRQVLFETGSYPVAVIPESSLDDFINGSAQISAENISEYINADKTVKSLGILGDSVVATPKTYGISMESLNPSVSDAQPNTSLNLPEFKHQSATFTSLGRCELINVYDNPYVLKFPQLAQKTRYNRVNEAIRNPGKSSKSFAGLRTSAGMALESRTSLTPAAESRRNDRKLNDVALTSLVYKNRFSTSKQFVKIKTSDEMSRENIGAPLVMKLPSEAVIPVYTPGQEEKHVGYFLLIDSEGNPLNKNSAIDHFSDLRSQYSGGSSNMSSYLLNKAKSGLYGDCTNMTNLQASRIYADVVEADILARLRNGVYGQNVVVGRNEDLYRIMFSRTMANQQTNLVYIPADLVTYFANRYDENGVGKSLLDDMRVLNSLRAMTLFARTMASIKNSIGRTDVALKLDDSDPNPQKTIEIATTEIMKTRQQFFPLGMNSPNDMVDWLARSGINVTFSGHPGIPDTSVSFTETATNYVKPDTELEEDLRKRAIMSLGLSPETVENGFSPEFATSIVHNNVLLTKRVLQIQEIFVPLLTDHARKVAFNDGGLIAKLKKEVLTHKDKLLETIDKKLVSSVVLENDELLSQFVVSEFLSNFELFLPQPDSVTLENQMVSLETYEGALEKVLAYYVSDELLPQDFAGEMGQKAGDIRNILKAYYMRKFMAENGIMPELQEIVTPEGDADGAMSLIEAQASHINTLVKNALGLLNKTHDVGAAAANDASKITGGVALGESAGSLGGGDTSFDTGSSGGGGGDDLGLGNMDFSMDMPSDETTDLPPEDPPEAGLDAPTE